jgi:diguanylate cyclase (GGDEF)-like protein
VQAPPLPDNDQARVGSLRRLGLLDTAPEERFDRITRVARRLFGVDTALVNLVDIDRQWAKSRQGHEALDSARELSFCGYAILGRDILEVPDAAADSRFSDNPMVVGEPRIRFYAGCPIASPEGAMIGTLCIVDDRPRSLEESDLAALRDLAAMVEHEIAVTRLSVDDELTGLVNRRGFVMIGTQVLAFCQRQRVDGLVVMATVDNLDVVGENAGPAAGERLLKQASSTIANTFRSSDVIGRVGADTFAALLAGYDGGGHQGVDRLKSAITGGNHEAHPASFEVSMTVGSARFDCRDPEMLEVLMQRAEDSRSHG